MWEFFSFRTMIVPGLMKLTYALGFVLITVFGIWTGFSGLLGIHATLTGMPRVLTTPESFPMVGASTPREWCLLLLALVLIHVFWRIHCEMTMLFFAIHERLVERNPGVRTTESGTRTP